MATQPVVTAIEGNLKNFSVFVLAVDRAGLAESLNNAENITLFLMSPRPSHRTISSASTGQWRVRPFRGDRSGTDFKYVIDNLVEVE
jgi:hypothetical protein